MGPDPKDKLISPNPKQRKEQERADQFAKSARLIEEGKALRKKAEELVKQADELLNKFKRDHPDA